MAALVVSTAIRPGSKTLAAARLVQWRLENDGFAVDLADLATDPFPPCGATAPEHDESVKAMLQRVLRAALVVICFPVYNYQPNSAARNFVDLIKGGFKGKVVTFVANMGGDRSYLASLPLANTLANDRHCVVVPQFVCLPAAVDANAAVVLEGATAELFEHQMKSAAHLARIGASSGCNAVDLESRPSVRTDGRFVS